MTTNIDPIFRSKFIKLLKNVDIDDFIKDFENSVIKKSPIVNLSYRRNYRFSICDYIYGIIDVLKNYESWNSYSGLIKGDTLRKNIIIGSNLVFMMIFTNLF